MEPKTIHEILDRLKTNRPNRPEKFDGGVFGNSKYAGWMASEEFILGLLIEANGKAIDNLADKLNESTKKKPACLGLTTCGGPGACDGCPAA